MIQKQIGKNKLKISKYFSQTATKENNQFQNKFDKYIGSRFKNNEFLQRTKYYDFKAKFDIAFSAQKEKDEYTQEEAGPLKQEKINLLLSEVKNLSASEFLYFNYRLEHHLNNMVITGPLHIQKSQIVNTSPHIFLDDQFLKQQQTFAELQGVGEAGFKELFNVYGTYLGLGGEGQQEQQGQEIKEEIKEKVVEKVIEKTNFDVVLIGIDPAQKIKIIKEVRAICNLGLKEAKDAVEKLPSTLFKQAIKEDAEKFKAMLIELGCQIELK